MVDIGNVLFQDLGLDSPLSCIFIAWIVLTYKAVE